MMCLSNVYAQRGLEQNLLCESVTGLAIDGLNITLTNLFGEAVSIQGVIVNIDLLKNTILIEPSA
jgi:predicted RNA-binding protein